MDQQNGPKNNITNTVIVVVLPFLVVALIFFVILPAARDDETDEGVSLNTNTNLNITNVEATEDNNAVEMTEAMEEQAGEMVYEYVGTLFDVTGGISSGIAQATYDAGQYMLLATFEDLDDPEGSDFYEGWIVRNSPLDVISTGVVEKKDGVYTNTYSSTQDLTDHDFYVLTLEPDDGDPAPADHVLEGTLNK